jgi:hypothetical protein
VADRHVRSRRFDVASRVASDPVRVTADWAVIETAPGVFDWSPVTTMLATLAERGRA